MLAKRSRKNICERARWQHSKNKIPSQNQKNSKKDCGLVIERLIDTITDVKIIKNPDPQQCQQYFLTQLQDYATQKNKDEENLKAWQPSIKDQCVGFYLVDHERIIEDHCLEKKIRAAIKAGN